MREGERGRDIRRKNDFFKNRHQLNLGPKNSNPYWVGETGIKISHDDSQNYFGTATVLCIVCSVLCCTCVGSI